MLKVAITGANGFVGSHIVDEYLKRNESDQNEYDIHCIVRKTSSIKWIEGKNITIHRCDYNSLDDLAGAIKGSEIVIHVAGSVAAKSYEEFYYSNVLATLNLAEAAKKSCPGIKRFVLISSQTASGPAKSLESPTLPEDECNPISSYGKSKRQAEIELLEKYNDLPITIIRPPAVFGPRDTAIYTVFQSISKGIATVMGFSPKYVTLVYVEDLARGIVDAAQSENSEGKTYFLGTEKPYSWPQINKMMAYAYGKSVITLKLPHIVVKTIGSIAGFIGKFMKKPPVFDGEKANDFVQPYWICSSESAHRDFGFEHSTSLQDAFSNTFDWYRKQGWIK